MLLATKSDGMVIVASVPPIEMTASPGLLPVQPVTSSGSQLKMTAAMAPASCAFLTLTTKSQAPRMMSATLPVTFVVIAAGVQACWPTPGVPVVVESAPVNVAVGPKAALAAAYWPATLAGAVTLKNGGAVHSNICIRPAPPSAGVEKLALLVPEASSASRLTASLPLPCPVKLVVWKLPPASSKP